MKILLKYIRFLLIIFLVIISITPFIVLILTSLTPTAGYQPEEAIFPRHFIFKNFKEAWHDSLMHICIINSLIITCGAILIVIFAAGAAGYAIARFSNKFHQIVLNMFLFCMMIPPIINTVPLYILMRSIAGINTHWAMILVCATNALPFSIFLYTNFIKSSSREIEESAIMDGCTWFTAFWRVTFPLMKPVTAAVVIINGVGIWNNYAQAVFFLQSRDVRTIPLGVAMFFQQYSAKWNQMAAAAAIGMSPVVAMFLVFQRYFLKGLAAGAVKG